MGKVKIIGNVFGNWFKKKKLLHFSALNRLRVSWFMHDRVLNKSIWWLISSILLGLKLSKRRNTNVFMQPTFLWSSRAQSFWNSMSESLRSRVCRSSIKWYGNTSWLFSKQFLGRNFFGSKLASLTRALSRAKQ